MQRTTKLYGLRSRFAASILTAALISAAVFTVLYFAKDQLISSYFEDPAVQSRIMEKRVTDLQNYVTKNHISSKDLSSLKKWENKQPLILLELYDENDLLYSSYYHIDSVIEEYMTENAGLTERNNLYTVDFGDKKLSAVMYMDISYRYYVLGNAIAFAIAVMIFILLYIRSNGELIRYIIRLGEDVQILEGGNLDYEVRLEGNDELTDLAKSMNRMRESFRNQLITEQELRQTSSKLISEMSHDLRTPLTGLMLYTEILKSGRYRDTAELNDYLDKIDAKARLMKQLSDNIFKYAIENRTDSDSEYMVFESAVSAVIKDISEELEASGFRVETDLEWNPVKIQIRKDLCGRISGNIVSNIIKYADRNAPVYIGTIYDGNYCGLSFINAVSGSSYDKDSHGIGLDSVKSMMNYMGGICTAEQTEEAFEVILMFRCI
jgi:signal transduction histidine kinase